MKRRHQFGVYFILKSMELGPSFRVGGLKRFLSDQISVLFRRLITNPRFRIAVR
jgi:hypothetical protein